MMDRAKQNWRKDAYTICDTVSDGYLLGDVDLRRAVVSPYEHELNHNGTTCATDCPACRWAEENQ